MTKKNAMIGTAALGCLSIISCILGYFGLLDGVILSIIIRASLIGMIALVIIYYVKNQLFDRLVLILAVAAATFFATVII